MDTSIKELTLEGKQCTGSCGAARASTVTQRATSQEETPTPTPSLPCLSWNELSISFFLEPCSACQLGMGAC